MASASRSALFFHPDAIEGKGKDLVGRRSAGQSFLRGYLRHMGGDKVYGLTEGPNAAQIFNQTCRDLGETREIEVASLRGTSDFTKLGTIFFPAPGYRNAAWKRQHFAPNACSLVGITHTVSTRRVVEELHMNLLQPIEPWDAIICTSRAVQSVVQRQMELEADFIKRRFGAIRVPVPQLPLIPLGINADDFTHNADHRAAMRKRFGADDDAIVVMTVGRLTSVEKANPVPMYLALEELAKTTGKDIHLWMVGWASRENEEVLHRKGAEMICPSVKTQIIDGRTADIRREIWSGADIFTLPVDNIQETFGLVPVEAMAASLPVVMPDWNGFRDTVIDGETGYMIPTTMPGPGSDMGANLARRFADGTDQYLHYLAVIQQQTQVDVRAYVAALTALATDPEKRKRMGAAGRTHVEAHLDWSAVIPQYQALSDELGAMRAHTSATTPRPDNGPISPIEVDPFDLYSRYPSHHPTPATQVIHRKGLSANGLKLLDQLNGRALYQRRIMPDERTLQIAAHIAKRGICDMTQLSRDFGLPLEVIYGVTLFLAKYDFVTLDKLGSN